MAELKDILESEESLEFIRPGIRLEPVPSADVPNRTIFINSDSVQNRLCFKDGDGNVFRFQLLPV